LIQSATASNFINCFNYGTSPVLRVSTVVEWNELRCFQLAHSYSTLWGKENEIA